MDKDNPDIFLLKAPHDSGIGLVSEFASAKSQASGGDGTGSVTASGGKSSGSVAKSVNAIGQAPGDDGTHATMNGGLLGHDMA